MNIIEFLKKESDIDLDEASQAVRDIMKTGRGAKRQERRTRRDVSAVEAKMNNLIARRDKLDTKSQRYAVLDAQIKELEKGKGALRQPQQQQKTPPAAGGKEAAPDTAATAKTIDDRMAAWWPKIADLMRKEIAAAAAQQQAPTQQQQVTGTQSQYGYR